MIKLNVNLGERGYPIYVTTDFTSLGKACAASRLAGQAVIVTDSNVDGIYCGQCMENLSDSGYKVSKYVFPAGENSKNLDTVRDIYKYLTSLKLDRSSTLIALGGGVTGDITGFAAATFLRGINYVQVPTTLLSQADSSLGGKTGVDFEGIKNIVGAFYQPRLVYINVNSLKTLPKREFSSGLAEVIKHGLILDADFFEYLDNNIGKIFACDVDVLQYMTKMNCSIKASVVEKDERESDLRAVLNFGNTIGHAIESAAGFKYLHGECVSVGIAGAYRIALHMGMVEEKTVARVAAALEKAGLPVKISGFDIQKVYENMSRDKKVKGGKLTFVLPRRIGEVIQCTLDEEELIKTVLSELFS